MIFRRKELLATLDSCAAGLAGAKSGIEQSGCYVFKGSRVYTFNDIVMCVADCPNVPDIAVPAKTLRETLLKSQEDDIDLSVDSGKMKLKLGRARATVNGHQDLHLPIETVESPGEWIPVDPELSDALVAVAECVGQEGDALDFIRVIPAGLVACDRFQVIQYAVKTGTTETLYIPSEGIRAIAKLGISGVSQGSNWMHFQTYSGVRASFRRANVTYPAVGQIFQQPVQAVIQFPLSGVDVFEKLGPFLEDGVEGKQTSVTLSPGKLEIRAQNSKGLFEDELPVEYTGDPVTFKMSPKLMASVVRYGEPIEITESTIRVTCKTFRYAVSIDRG